MKSRRTVLVPAEPDPGVLPNALVKISPCKLCGKALPDYRGRGRPSIYHRECARALHRLKVSYRSARTPETRERYATLLAERGVQIQ